MVNLLRVLPLGLGWFADLIFGDPQRLPHPIVGMGKIIAACEKRLNCGNRKRAKGALMAVGLTVSTFVITWLLLRLLEPWRPALIVVESMLIFYCLAGTTLIREVREVFAAADRSIEEGRKQVGRIVGRDTATLSVGEIRTAALETLAENLSDGVVAPLFWYALLGVPGMLAYKMVNTLDSMIGYRTARYREFGCWAAHIDDIANWVPARLTASLMALTSFSRNAYRSIRRYGRCHASPNSGYPEAALAGILKCRFGGAHDYFGEAVYKPYIGECERELTSSDCRRAIAINRRVEVATVLLAAIVRLAI